MRKILVGLVALALLSPLTAGRRNGLEVKGGVNLNFAQAFRGYLNIGPRLDLGYYDYWFYAGGRVSYLYSSIHEDWNLRLGILSGWRSNFTQQDMYITALLGVEYHQAPWDALTSDEGTGPEGVFSITFEPGITARFTDWFSLHIEVPIAFPLGQEGLEPDVKGFIYLSAYYL